MHHAMCMRCTTSAWQQPPDTAGVETAIFELPKKDGIPVLSPLHSQIERGETLRILRGQVDQECSGSVSLRRAMNSLDLLVLEQYEDGELDDLFED